MLPSAAILRLFREQDGFVSGEMISRELHVSRTAIWKQINALRKAGYVIEAVPSRGYQLLSAPDLLSSAEIAVQLDAVVMGSRIVCLEQTASTNGDAFRLAEQGAAEGTVVLADTQSGGKGRMGRVWSSPPGVNLYCSIILRPAIMPYEAPQLTFLSAVAVARSIERISAIVPEIKWPNDVLIKGQKVAGLLNEMSAETDAVNFVILGIGVNLNMTAGQFPDDLRHPATSILLESGRPVGRAGFCAIMLNELDRLYADFRTHGFGPVREEWQRRCNAHGRELSVSDGGSEVVRGMFAGIDGSGALLVSGADGAISKILSGDVRVL
ncbi:biotin--[acetyl-CoA-carboxylase] ligase [Pelobacter propionicus]|uniref:Bifunctional ligase/repressor BirA n=1 Tax=Pelobacter propionicus (strain DSM 2379 / NBRC 103807 / OttBd1) TaxID=338966 RepID=A1ALR5_PELPD|nr:biotin--[acetyl-CoA-carboxylase] ligase [Pelobacter propionicus]ABK98285.1 biotin--acetyl-CoA-carboxylase ligase [Pelobacter propionicus DSM 2379]